VVRIETAVDAHAAIVTVLKIFSASDPAETAISTVVRPFIVGHPEIANVAVVFSKLDAALDAIVAEKEENKRRQNKKNKKLSVCSICFHVFDRHNKLTSCWIV
jgi:hypothetical protein